MVKIKTSNNAHIVEFAKGRIVQIKKVVDQDNTIITGVPRSRQYKYGGPMCKGSNGTYLAIGEYHGTRLFMDINIYDLDKPVMDINGNRVRFESCKLRLDIYKEFKELLNVERISPKAFDELMNHKGVKIEFSVVTFDDTLKMGSDNTGTIDIVVVFPIVAKGKIRIVKKRTTASVVSVE